MKKKRIPTAVFAKLMERFKLSKSAIKMRIYRNDLTIIEAVKTEMDLNNADKIKAAEIKKTIYGGML